MRTWIRLTAWPAAALAAALLGAACGDDGDDDGGEAPRLTHLWFAPDGAGALGADGRAAFTAGTLYQNAHTAANPGGELRGQLDAGGETRFTVLTGAEEVPPVSTGARGVAAFSVDGATGAIRGFVLTAGLAEATAAHVHPGAPGVNGSPIVPLTGGPELWVVPAGAAPLTADQRQAFLDGNLYVNVHTAANPGGAIRGQLSQSGDVRFAALDGAQEVPAVTAGGRGFAVLVVDDTASAAGFEVTAFAIVAGISNTTVGHVHGPAARGASASPIVDLVGTGPLWTSGDDATITSEERDAFLAGQLYVNVHTGANPTGELRGQLDRQGVVRLATLEGAQEVPAVTSTALGAGLLAVDASSGQVSGLMVTAGLVDPTVGHVHGPAARGANASPVVDFVRP
jgi:hypothetical protein